MTGPAGARRAYRVAEPEGLTGGQGTVFHAQVGEGAPLSSDFPEIEVSLKQWGTVSPDRALKLVDRSNRLTKLHHAHLARHLATFQGPGLFLGEPPPEDECDCLYSASAWVEGRSLQSLGEVPTVDAALNYLKQLADAVQYLHSAGLTHRDLHPGNVIINGHQLTVIDLGFARAAGQAGVTLVHGAAGFVPPERFDDPSSGDVSCDRWQVAMVGVYLLLGRPRGRTPLPVLVDELQTRLTGSVPSPRDTALRLTSMLAENPDARPAMALSSWAARLASPGPVRRRGRAWASAAVVAVVAAGIVAAVVLSSGAHQRVAAATSTVKAAPGCPAKRGQAAAPGLDAAHAKLLPGLQRELTSVPASVCARTPVAPFGNSLVQQLVGIRQGAVYQNTAGNAFVLSRAQWDSYRQIGGKDNREAPKLVGEITGVKVAAGWSELDAKNGIVIGAGPEEPHFWLPPQLVSLWRSTGGAAGRLGLPTSNVQFTVVSFIQQFQHGFATLFLQAKQPQITYVAAPSASLPSIPFKNHILRQADATAWFIDSSGRRHWIANGGVWKCVGGDAILMPGDVPGYAIVSIPNGGPSYCGEGADGEDVPKKAGKK